MHSQKTKQPYIRRTRKNRTRKKSAVEDDPRNRPEKNKKNEPFEQLKSTEPVYDLFTIMGEIMPSESLSRVTYTGMNSMHSQKTKQPYIQSTRSSKRSKTTKKNSWVDKDLTKSPKKKYFEENGAV